MTSAERHILTAKDGEGRWFYAFHFETILAAAIPPTGEIADLTAALQHDLGI